MKIAIFGAGGHGKVAADIALSSGYNEIFFFDDQNKSKDINKIGKYVGAKNKIDDIDKSIPFFVGIGDNIIREKIFEFLVNKSRKIVSLIHKSAILSKNANIKNGVIIMPNAVINSSTLIAKGCIINTSASIDHDCEIKKFTHICPGVTIAGNVKVGQRSFIGIGTSVVNNISIGSNVFVNGGSFVYKNVSSNFKFKN